MNNATVRCLRSLRPLLNGLLIASLSLPLGHLLASARDEEKLDVFVCQESKLWTRPTEQAQRRRLRNRSRRREPTPQDVSWVRDFIFYQGEGGESAQADVEKLSGAWSANEVTRHCTDTEWKEQIEDGRFLELWSFFHEVLSVVRKGNVYTVTVKPTGKGYQFVRFARTGQDAAGSMELVVVTPSGELLETLTEKSGVDDRGPR